MVTALCYGYSMKLDTATPSEIDSHYAPIAGELGKLNRQRNSYAEGAKKAAAGDARYTGYDRYLASFDAQHGARIAELTAIVAEWDAEYDRRGGWTRYYLCTSDGGHIHVMGCHTLTPFKTTVSFMPELSGLNESELVERVGFKACSKCFPTAPSFPAWIKGAAEAEAAKKAKEAAKCPGSGRYVTSNRLYVPCPECGKLGRLSPYGAVRAHKAEAAK